MQNPGLAALLVALLAVVPPAFGLTPRAEEPAVAAARETLKSLAAAPESGRAQLLLRLRGQLDAVHSSAPPAPALRKLEDAEHKLWEAPGNGEQLKVLRSAFEAAFPDSSAPAARIGAAAPIPPRSPESEKALASARAAAARANAGRAIADPNAFFDGHAGSRGGGAGPRDGASTPAPRPAPGAPDRSAVPAISDLRHAPVPAPAPAAKDEGSWRGALRTAQRYAETGAKLALLLNPATAPLVLVPVVQSAAGQFRRDNTPSPESARSCAQAVQGTPYFATNVAELCRTSPAVAPIVAGLLDSVKQQFGTIGGIVSTIVSLLAGVLLGALTGGVGLVIKILVAVGMTVYAAWQMISGLQAAIRQYNASKEGSPERYDAIRKVGVVGGSLLLMGVLALVGAGAGKLMAGTRAAGAMNSAASSLVSKLGIEGLMASMEAKLPWLGKLAPAADGEKPPPPPNPTDIPGNRSRIKLPEPPPEVEPAQGETATAVKPSPPNPYKPGEVSKATAWRLWAERQGWKFSQTENGPIKYTDKNGTLRLQIKQGSARAPGSENPHIELRDEAGRYIDPRNGNVVNRRTPENHMQINWDLP